jgi:hypothetical protein
LSSEPPVIDVICPHCGAKVDPAWAQCWMCESDLTAGKVRTAQPPGEAAFAVDSTPGLVASIAVVAAVGLVWLGVTLSAPGVGVLLAIAAVPPVFRTITVVRKRQASGKETSAARTGLMFVMSLVVTGVMLAVTGFVAFWTFCLTCVAAAAVTRSNEEIVMVFAGGSTVAVVGLMGWLFWKLVRLRYRSDVAKP